MEISELVLKIPKEYKLGTLFQTPQNGLVNILHIKVLNKKIVGTNIFLTFKVLTSNENINGVIFNFRYFHTKLFAPEMVLYIQGKVSSNSFGTQIINPYPISKPDNKIKVIYKDKRIKPKIEKNVTFENLKKIGLPDEVIQNLLKIHINPTEDFVKYFEENKTFPQDIIYSLKFFEAFLYIKKMRKGIKSFPAIQKLDGEIQKWIENLPFDLTNDQKNAIEEIRQDLSGEFATRRIIVGDVGSGKTMVILASIIIAHPFKSILMAPTSILAKQLYEEATKFLPKHYNIVFLTSKTSKKIAKEKQLENFDVLIGTSAILYQKLPETPLIIIDEQHRFGTKDRNKLQKLVESNTKQPHFLQLSATPIPRTQAMINSAFVKTSIIEETPFEKDIETQTIFSKDFPNLLEKIREEISKNHQVLIIYPLVEESEKMQYQPLLDGASYWKENFENVYLTHGKDRKKEEILEEFREKGSILLATTVVEVGISLPRLSVIVIVGAERLGLATLHQLRGRVGRTGLKSFCYLFTKSQDEKAIMRLKKFGQVKNGFDIASMDLKFRKSGNILDGLKQSGDSFQWLDLSEDKNVVDEVLKYF